MPRCVRAKDLDFFMEQRLWDAGTSVAEVDSVLTSGEVQLMLEVHGRPLGELPSARLDSLVGSVPEDGQIYGLPGGSGAGLAHLYSLIRPVWASLLLPVPFKQPGLHASHCWWEL